MTTYTNICIRFDLFLDQIFRVNNSIKMHATLFLISYHITSQFWKSSSLLKAACFKLILNNFSWCFDYETIKYASQHMKILARLCLHVHSRFYIKNFHSKLARAWFILWNHIFLNMHFDRYKNERYFSSRSSLFV